MKRELDIEIDEYEKSFKPSDSAEWRVVVDELDKFLETEKSIVPACTMGFFYRLQSDQRSLLKGISKKVKLQNAILVSSHANQVKFSELSVDMLRMISALERENLSEKKENPRKYLLFKPSIQQLLLFFCTAFNELADDASAMLLYLSGQSVAGKVF